MREAIPIVILILAMILILFNARILASNVRNAAYLRRQHKQLILSFLSVAHLNEYVAQQAAGREVSVEESPENPYEEFYSNKWLRGNLPRRSREDRREEPREDLP